MSSEHRIRRGVKMDFILTMRLSQFTLLQGWELCWDFMVFSMQWCHFDIIMSLWCQNDVIDRIQFISTEWCRWWSEDWSDVRWCHTLRSQSAPSHDSQPCPGLPEISYTSITKWLATAESLNYNLPKMGRLPETLQEESCIAGSSWKQGTSIEAV